MKVKDLKRGEYFTFQDVLYPKPSQVWVRGEYDKSSRKYSCTNFDDVSKERFVSGDKVIFDDFIF